MSGSLSGRILFARVIRAGYNAVPVCRAATLNSAAFPATGYAVAVALLLKKQQLQERRRLRSRTPKKFYWMRELISVGIQNFFKTDTDVSIRLA